MPKIIHSTDPLLPDIFALHGKWRAQKPAIITETETLDWKSFNERTYQVANGLIKMGLEKGDRVIVLMSNGLPMMEALFGVMAGGFVSAPLNVSVTNESILNMVLDSGAKAILVSEEYASRIENLKTELPKEIYENRVCAGAAIKGWISYKTWREEQSETRPNVDLKPEDYLNIIYSSGTTGQPKGIVHTHKGRRDWAYDMALTLRYNSSARFLVTIGLYSNITWVGLLSTMLTGGTVLINGKFEASELWQRIEKDKITHLSMVPTLYERMMDFDHEQYDASSIQGMMSAGSPLREPVKAALFDRFDCGIIELYGLTEGVITTLDPEDAAGRLASVGLPLLGTDLKILDDEDRECKTGQAGEIISCGRIVMPEYFNKEEVTKDALWVDENGTHWLRTGDIGYLDEEGFLYIVDRKKDMILSGGQNVYPQDIEAVIACHDEVRDVAVIGVKSRKWGETPLAVIAAKNAHLDKEALRDWTNKQVGKQQRIVDVDIVEEIPRNPNGKILKRAASEKNMRAVSLTKSYQDIFYKSSDGLSLYARDYDDGGGKPVILGLHGLTRNSADFHDLAQHLRDQFRVITVDQRGRGLSDYDPNPGQYRPDIYCEDMFRLLDYLGLKNVISIGTSMGGLMTMIMASQKPDILRAAIINDIGPEIAPAGLERIKGYVGVSRDFASWEEAADAIKSQQSTKVFPLYTSQDWMAFAKRVCKQTPEGRIEFAYDPALANPFKEDDTVSAPVDMWPFFAGLKSIPVLTLRGERSDILSVATLENMERSHPNFTAVTIPNIGHAPILTEPESLAAIDRFLKPFT